MSKLKSFLTSSFSIVLLLTLCCVLLYFSELTNLLAYRRGNIQLGEWWRLVTGNLLHTNGWHLLMNLAGLWVIALLHNMHYRCIAFLSLFAALCLLQGIGLYLLFPNLIGYVGLSGMLHGLFTYGAVKDISVGIKSGYLLLLGVMIKVAYEQYFGASAQVSKMIDANVATEAHLVGVIAGLAILSGIGLYRFGKQSFAR